MRYLLAPLLLIFAIIVVYKIFRSKKVDTFLDNVVTKKPTPGTAEALKQDASRIELEKAKLARDIAQRKADLEREHDSLPKETK